MSNEIKQFYEFGPFHLDTSERCLLRNGKPVALTPKLFDTLLVLVENSGRTLDKNVLMHAVWPDRFVEESSLSQNIFQLRKILGDAESGEQYIETIPKRGYRFAAGVGDLSNGRNGDPIVARQSETSFTEVEQSGRNHEIDNLIRANDQTQLPAVLHHDLSGRISRRPALVVSLTAVVILATGIYVWQSFGSGSSADPRPEIKTIAVLPFMPVDAESTDEQLRLGMADALISRISHFNEFTIRPTSAVLTYGDLGQDALAAGRKLEVDAVLKGTIQRVGDRLRVNVQLVRVRDGVLIWSEQFDKEFKNIFTIQKTIAEQVAGKLIGKLSDEARTRLAKHYTENPEAYQAYVRGRYFWNKRTEDGFRKGIEHFRQAIEIDPGYALAYTGLADSYLLLASGQYGNVPPEDNFERARAAAARALELDRALAEAHATLASVSSNYDGDWPAAERSYRRAIELNPNYATARHWYAWDLLVAERAEEALQQMKRAQELDPLSPSINLALGQFYYHIRNYDEAIKQSNKTLDLDPHLATARVFLGMSYEQQGRRPEAIAEFNKILARYETHAAARGARAHTHAIEGKKAEAQKVLREMEKHPSPRPVLIFEMAILHTALGDKERALSYIEKISANKSRGLVVRLKFDPRLDALRSDPRFESILNTD